MGARAHMSPRLLQILPEHLEFGYVGRPERASPGEGYPAAHTAEQNRILRTALDLGVPVERVPEEDSGRALSRARQAARGSVRAQRRRVARRSVGDAASRERRAALQRRGRRPRPPAVVELLVGEDDRQLGVDDARADGAEDLARLGLRPDGAEHAGARADDGDVLPLNGLSAIGRESQSIAFFSAPGSEWLYSGVATRMASARCDRVAQRGDRERARPASRRSSS